MSRQGVFLVSFIEFIYYGFPPPFFHFPTTSWAYSLGIISIGQRSRPRTRIECLDSSRSTTGAEKDHLTLFLLWLRGSIGQCSLERADQLWSCGTTQYTATKSWLLCRPMSKSVEMAFVILEIQFEDWSVWWSISWHVRDIVVGEACSRRLTSWVGIRWEELIWKFPNFEFRWLLRYSVTERLCFKWSYAAQEAAAGFAAEANLHVSHTSRVANSNRKSWDQLTIWIPQWLWAVKRFTT